MLHFWLSLNQKVDAKFRRLHTTAAIISSSSPKAFSPSWNLRLVGLLSVLPVSEHEFPTRFEEPLS